MRQIVVESGQSIIDIAVKEFGTADGLKVVCDLNGLEYDDDLYPGMVMSLPDLDPDNRIQTYFKDKGIEVNSHVAESDVQVLATNDDEIIGTNDNEAIRI